MSGSLRSKRFRRLFHTFAKYVLPFGRAQIGARTKQWAKLSCQILLFAIVCYCLLFNNPDTFQKFAFPVNGLSPQTKIQADCQLILKLANRLSRVYHFTATTRIHLLFFSQINFVISLYYIGNTEGIR